MCASDAQATGAGPGKHCPAPGCRRDRGLSRPQRITGSHIFKEAFNAGRRQVGRFMVLWLRSGTDAGLRLGVVTSKRTFRRAVDRVRARRLLREAYRLNRYRFSGTVDVVLVARGKMAGEKLQAVETDLLALAAKAGIMGENK